MEDIRLSRHVIDRLEHRWASRLQQDAKTWSIDRNRPAHARHVHTDGARAIPVIVKRRCVCRKLDSAILMVKATKDRS